MRDRSRHVPAADVGRLLAAAVQALGGTPRTGQQQMASAVRDAVVDERHVLVQAGTGTGKSLAYLVPAIAHAVSTGRPVVVSTATLALQAQVVERDLPRVADALAAQLGRRPTWEVVKGRANYVCQHKLAGGFPAEEAGLFTGPTSQIGRDVVRLREWAGQTGTGERDELVPGVSDRAWRSVSVSAHECLGQRCPEFGECFVEASRARAHVVDVVVTNHAFLAIDAFEGRQMLPEHDVVVVDEAHELADRVTGVVSDEITSASVEAAARQAASQGGTDSEALLRAGSELAAVLDTLQDGRFAAGLPEQLVAALGAVRDEARGLLSALKDPGDAEALGSRQVARAAVEEVFDVTDRLVEARSDDVVWMSTSERRGQVLHAAPLSVAALLAETFFPHRTVVATSATLTVGGTFDAVAAGLGLTGERASPYTALDVGSPFDYQRQAVLYIAAHLPPPGRDGLTDTVLDEIAALVTAAGGRTLGLFSSRRAAEAAAEAMRRRLDVPVLCQGDDQTPTLVRAFARDARTCLFGTLSLWQGVDVPGSACQLVIVDRIPFPRPDDPLSSARAQAVSRAGGNGFMDVAATHAALRLAQGVGRLIRTATDRGVVAVLDPRLATARYAGFLRASLPPMWSTADTGTVLEALRRIDSGAADVDPVDVPVPRLTVVSTAAPPHAAPPAPQPPASRAAVVAGVAVPHRAAVVGDSGALQ